MTTSRKRAAETKLRYIDLRSPEITSDIDLRSVRDYVASLLPAVNVRVLPPPHKGLSKSQLHRLAEHNATARVRDPSRRTQSAEPMYGEVDYELRVLSGKAKLGGVVYDGRKLAEAYADLLGTEQGLEVCSIVFTQRLVTTYSDDDLRHHLRTIVCGFPSVVSIPGVVEAPAKPRDYYFLRQQLEASGASQLHLEELKSSFRGRFLDYGDPRIADVLRGLSLQAVMFHLTLRPFCDKISCRLFNAHWQEDLIKSQITSGELCKKHADEIHELGRSPSISW